MSHLTPEQLEAPSPTDAAHLEGCARCRDAVRLARGRQQLLKGMKPYTLSDMAFSRVDAKLMELARENPPGPRFSFGRLLAVVALAAVAGLLVVSSVRPLFENKVEPAAVAAAFEPMTVVHASGAVSLKAGDVLQRDAVVDALNGTVLLATADGAALRLGGGARYTLGQTDATVRYSDGRFEVDAKSRGPWVVAVGPHWVRAADASFDVAADELDLYRGSVVLADNASFSNGHVVNAPAKVVLHDLSVGPLAAGGTEGLRKTALSPWARLELGLSASEVELDGQHVGGAPLSLLTSPGRHHLRAHVGEAWREADVDLSTSGTGKVELPEKVTVVAPLPPPGPVVEADPEAIAAAIKAQLPKLRVCHEKWLKVNESARGKVLMTVTVSPKGHVTRSQFASDDDGVPESVNECLARALRAMTLPRSSEEVELEIPVHLGGP